VREQVQRDPTDEAKCGNGRKRKADVGKSRFSPNANSTMPATIGRCRYEYAPRASAARTAPVVSTNLAWAT
jgi:hypothetical protein